MCQERMNSRPPMIVFILKILQFSLRMSEELMLANMTYILLALKKVDYLLSLKLNVSLLSHCLSIHVGHLMSVLSTLTK